MASVDAARADSLATDYFTALIETYPLVALGDGVPNAPNDKLDDNSLAATAAWRRREDAWSKALSTITPASLIGRPEEATFAVLRELIDAAREMRVCHAELMPLDQLGGWQISLPVVAHLQPLGTPRLRAAALARWRQIPRYIDTEIGVLREGIKAGYTQPRGNAQAVLQELDGLLRLSPESSPFAALAERDSTPGFRDSVVAIVRDGILPATHRYRDFVANEYVPHARSSTALSALPRGVDCYKARVRAFTTRELDPRTVFDLGRQQMASLESEMRPIAQRMFGSTDLAAVHERLRTDSAYVFHSRAEIIQTADQAVARARAAIPQWFGRLPRGRVVVDPCAPFEEKSGCPNSYVPGTPDGSRPGRWRINAGNDPPQPIAPLEGTAFHETIPGHHLQIALAEERPDAHPITRYLGFSGYWEGWALYAERLAMQMGLYSSDLASFGELGEQALRAARLVVDPGLAVFGWSRQQAIDYMVAHTGESRQAIESEVDRYISGPGQATSYMVGRLEIEQLRHEAETRLGRRFDIREFHDRVLEEGAVPLAELRAHVERWIASRADSAR